MARKASGTLVWTKTKGWVTRIPVLVAGERIKQTFDLGTDNRALAHRGKDGRTYHPKRSGTGSATKQRGRSAFEKHALIVAGMSVRIAKGARKATEQAAQAASLEKVTRESVLVRLRIGHEALNELAAALATVKDSP